MTDTLITHHLPGVIDVDWISRYLPALRGYVVNHFRWMEQRGNCLVTTEDLIQVASMELVKLAAKWGELAKTFDRVDTLEAEEKLFWGCLVTATKSQFKQYYNLHTRRGKTETNAAIDDFEGDWWEERTSVRLLHEMPGSALARHAIVDYYASMPVRDKVHIALRYFDELPIKQVESLLGTSAVSKFNSGVIQRMRVVARNQFLEFPEPDPIRHSFTWEPPELLLTYLRDRHRKDIHEYLGIVTIAFREDVSYLVDILGFEKTMVPGAQPIALSPAQQHQIDIMLSEGLSQESIAHRLGITRTLVRRHSARRHAIA